MLNELSSIEPKPEVFVFLKLRKSMGDFSFSSLVTTRLSCSKFVADIITAFPCEILKNHDC